MKSIYALLVGINEYPKQTKPLHGCVNDVKKIEQFILSQYSDNMNVQIKTLLNQDATYDQVYQAFESHLAKATGDDAIWFHYSGHGTEEKSAAEFLEYDSTGKDQTMLLYDSKVNGKNHLADKELAVLLNFVATKFPDHSPKEIPPHIMISLDCCHSGSGTRSTRLDDKYVGIRSERSSGQTRDLMSYSKGYYARQNANELTIPSSPHIVMSACERHQTAKDKSDGGIFTTGLIKALKDSNGKINYPDLFLRTRTAVRQLSSDQDPKFSFISNINPYTEFLNGASLGSPDEYEVYFKNGKWFLKCGVIHGLPAAPKEEISVEIKTPAPESRKIGDATIISIGPHESEMIMDLEFSIKSTFKSLFDQDADYRAIMHSIPLPIEHVYVAGVNEEENRFMEGWHSEKNIKITNDSAFIHNLKIEYTHLYELHDIIQNKIIFKSSDKADFTSAIKKAVNWYRFLALHNSNPNSKLGQEIKFSLEVLDLENKHKTLSGNKIILQANDRNSQNESFGFMPKVRIQKINQDLYFYLFYLSPDYAIECPEEETLFDGDTDGDGVTDIDELHGVDGILNTNGETNPSDPTDFNESQITLLPRNTNADTRTLDINLWKEYKGLGPAPNEHNLDCHFKLIVTTEELDYFQFIQSGISKTRSHSTNRIPPSTKISDEWAVFDIHLKIELE